MIRTCSVCGKRNRVPARHLASRGRCGACKTALPPVDRPLEVGAQELDEIVAGATVPVLVDFWAEWCAPCRVAAPVVARVANQVAGKAVVLKVNTERHPELAARYRIASIPSFLVFRSGEIVHRQAGVVHDQQMAGWLTRAAA